MEYTNRYLEHLKDKERQRRADAEARVREAEGEQAKRMFLGTTTTQNDEDRRLEMLRNMLAYRVVYDLMRRLLTPEMFERRYPELLRGRT